MAILAGKGMTNERGMMMKWLHRLLTIVLLVLVVGNVAYRYYVGPPYDDGLYQSRQLNDDTWLYVTKYQGGGATVSEVYRYYLAGEIQKDVLKVLGNTPPFLTSDSDGASVTKVGNRVTVRITGRIYDFTNSVFYTSDGVDVIPTIELYGINSR
ncbi:hypothetical protein [Erwinia rhapontici]|uniref:hypothetical protein n=1 Tax=Erwinia rhapontici TaxID=55212 RepID=UPI001331A525|nr:hypothetical protein [Erwinia rhapontici]MBP2153973.1 hypothetical protein [Erwinia rhapontici]